MGEVCGSTHCFAAGVCPLGLMRGLNQVVLAVPHPRFASEAPPAHAAAVSLRSAPSRGVRGRARPIPVSSDRTRGNDAGTKPATFPRG